MTETAVMLGSNTVPPVPTASRVAVSPLLLLAIYAVVPLCLLTMIADKLFRTESIFSAMPSSPESLFFFQILFGTPHIMASNVILATNSEYLRTYGLRILVFSLILLVFFGGGALLHVSDNFFLAVVGSATVMHVIRQQVGIGRSLGRVSSRVYSVWGWTLVAFGSVLYYALYAGSYAVPGGAIVVHAVLLGLGALALATALVCHRRIPTSIGRWYLWANTAMVLLSGVYYVERYSFLAILAPRLAHDITAFVFYVAHDVNRHGDQPRNLLYRVTRRLHLGTAWVCPVVAVVLTFVVARYADAFAYRLFPMLVVAGVHYRAGFLIAGYLGMVHYYTETFTWAKGSPYRPYVRMTG